MLHDPLNKYCNSILYIVFFKKKKKKKKTKIIYILWSWLLKKINKKKVGQKFIMSTCTCDYI
jgi:hypothetical protein